MRIKKRCEGGGAGEGRTKKRRWREKEFLAEGRKLFNAFLCQRPIFKK